MVGHPPQQYGLWNRVHKRHLSSREAILSNDVIYVLTFNGSFSWAAYRHSNNNNQQPTTTHYIGLWRRQRPSRHHRNNALVFLLHPPCNLLFDRFHSDIVFVISCPLSIMMEHHLNTTPTRPANTMYTFHFTHSSIVIHLAQLLNWHNFPEKDERRTRGTWNRATRGGSAHSVCIILNFCGTWDLSLDRQTYRHFWQWHNEQQ